VEWSIAEHRWSAIHDVEGGTGLQKPQSQRTSQVEHPFRMIKAVFEYGKVRYRGLAKNRNRLYVLAGLFNLLRVKRMLLP